MGSKIGRATAFGAPERAPLRHGHAAMKYVRVSVTNKRLYPFSRRKVAALSALPFYTLGSKTPHKAAIRQLRILRIWIHRIGSPI